MGPSLNALSSGLPSFDSCALAFARVDADCDGEISYVELVTALQADAQVRVLLGLPQVIQNADGSRAAVDALCKQLSADIGTMKLGEFRDIFPAQQMRTLSMPPPASAKVPSAPCTSSASAIATDELARPSPQPAPYVVASSGLPSFDSCALAFARVDADCDGEISYVELVTALQADAQVRVLLGLPQVIQNADGSRAAVDALCKQLSADIGTMKLGEFRDIFPGVRRLPTSPSSAPAFGSPGFCGVAGARSNEVGFSNLETPDRWGNDGNAVLPVAYHSCDSALPVRRLGFSDFSRGQPPPLSDRQQQSSV